MGVALDEVAERTLSGVTSITWAHTCAGTPTGVAVMVQGSNGGDNVTSVKWGGTSGTSLGAAHIKRTQGTHKIAQIYGLTSPAGGTQDVVVTFSASNWVTCGSVTVTGGLTSGSPFKADTASGGSAAGGNPSITVANVIADDMVIDCFCWGNTNNPSPSASGQTQRMSGLSNSVYGKASTKESPASGTMSWSTSGFPEYAIVATAFAPAAAPKSFPPLPHQMQVLLTM